MGLQTEEKSNIRSSFLKALLEKRRQKKRAPSFDGTLESSTSSMDHSRRSFWSLTPHNQNLASVYAPIIVVEEEGSDESLLNDAVYKRDVAMANRVAALNAQQQLLGENHPDVLFSLQNLAALHYRRGEYAQAQRIMEDNQLRRERAQNELKTSNIPTEIFIQL